MVSTAAPLYFIYLDFPLIASSFFQFFLPGLTSECQTCWDLGFLEKSLIWLNCLFSSKGLSGAFIGCETLFYSASLFKMSKQISDVMYHAMSDRARMKCPSIFEFFFSFSFFFIYWMRNANVVCKYHDWSYQCVMQPLCPTMLLTNS